MYILSNTDNLHTYVGVRGLWGGGSICTAGFCGNYACVGLTIWVFLCHFLWLNQGNNMLISKREIMLIKYPQIVGLILQRGTKPSNVETDLSHDVGQGVVNKDRVEAVSNGAVVGVSKLYKEERK